MRYFPLFFLAACGGKAIDQGLCAEALTCAAAVDFNSYQGLLASWGETGTCWGEPGRPVPDENLELCREACAVYRSEALALFPREAACGASELLTEAGCVRCRLAVCRVVGALPS